MRRVAIRPALHFHHLDPNQKRYTLSRAGHTRKFADALEEARKCVLLCANCHAEVERGVTAFPMRYFAGLEKGTLTSGDGLLRRWHIGLARDVIRGSSTGGARGR